MNDDVIYPPGFYKNTPPSLDPADRTARGATGHRRVFGPGLVAGTTCEWRETLGVFDNQRDPTTRNTCIFRGWNYDVGGELIDPTQGAIGSGEENSYQPASPAQTWSENHGMRGTAPGGVERRMASSVLVWEDGTTYIQIAGTNGNVAYVPSVGSSTTLIGWASLTMNVAGNGFSFGSPTSYFLRQLEVGSSYYIGLPYVAESNEIPRGWNPSLSLIPVGRERGIRWIPTSQANCPTPATGVTMFLDSSTGALSQKDTGGTVTPLSSELPITMAVLTSRTLHVGKDTAKFEEIAGTTPSTTDGDTVGNWRSLMQSGGVLLTLADNATRPLYRPAGGPIATVAAVEWDGTNARPLQIVDGNSILPSGASAVTLAAVFYANPDGAFSFITSRAYSGNGVSIVLNAANQIEATINTTGAANVLTSNAVSAGWYSCVLSLYRGVMSLVIYNASGHLQTLSTAATGTTAFHVNDTRFGIGGMVSGAGFFAHFRAKKIVTVVAGSVGYSTYSCRTLAESLAIDAGMI